MSIVKRHDVVQTGLTIADRKVHIKELEQDKDSWADFQWQERDKLIKDLHTVEVNAVRQHANLAVDHQKMLKAEFNDTWTATVGTTKQATLKVNKKLFRGKHLKLNIVSEGYEIDSFEQEPPTGDDDGDDNHPDGDGDGEQGGDDEQPQISYTSYINITPTSINGFQALKKKWQYFKINKISVKFVSNSANNLSPIVCRYMPPMGKQGDVTKLNIDYITKYGESVGTTCGFVSLHMPPCLVKKGEFDKDNAFQYGENGYCLPNLNKDRMLCSYEDDKFYLDYGTFIFESKNIGTVQNIIAQIHYCIDFYSGYDYECASITEEEDGNKPDDGGNDDGDGDGDDDGNHGKIVPPKGCYKRTFNQTPTIVPTKTKPIQTKK